MDEQSARSLYEQKIDQMIATFLPNGAGTINETRFRHALEQVALTAFSAGESYALLSLMTVEDMAHELGVSPRRVRAIAKVRHERFAVGYQVSGTSQWLFRPAEIESLRPWADGRPRKTK
jgi:hypothetical protein